MKSFINDTISLTPAAWWETWGSTVSLVFVVVIISLFIGTVVGDLIKKWKSSKGLNIIQKVCILIFVMCFFFWAGFRGYEPIIAVISFGVGASSFIGFFLFKDK